MKQEFQYAIELRLFDDQFSESINFTCKTIHNNTIKKLRQMVYGQKATGQKATKNATLGQKATHTKSHHAGFSLEKS